MLTNQKNSILIVDDEGSNIIALRSMLSGNGYTAYAATNGKDAIETATDFLPDLILLDVLMPDMDGFEVAKVLKATKKTADIPIIFITGLDSKDAETKGFNLGASDYITKPFHPEVVRLRVKNQITTVNGMRTLSAQSDMLKRQADALVKLRNSMAFNLASMIESRDDTTGKHIERVAKYVKILINAMLEKGLYKEEILHWDVGNVAFSSLLHDIGKIAVPDAVLNKPGKLTEEEFAKMKNHAPEGEKIIDRIIQESGSEEFLLSAKTFAGCHHEHWNGGGYPRGLSGTDIPLRGRIIAIADTYDALTSSRPYKPALPHEKAVEIITNAKGTQFDPQLVDLFVEVNGWFKA